MDKKTENANVELTEQAEVIDADEQDIITKMNQQENADEKDEELDDIIARAINDVDDKKFKNSAWWVSIPKRDRFKAGDIIYHVNLDRFGIFIQPCRKEGLVRLRLFKLRSKTETYTRDWYLDFDDVMLVKRGKYVKPGFVETPDEFAKRAGRQIKRNIQEA
jgi:hypothetical protein